MQTLAVARRPAGPRPRRRLLRALLDEARRAGRGEVLLEVRAENDARRSALRPAGFERIGVRRGYYRPGGTDAHVLRLPH